MNTATGFAIPVPVLGEEGTVSVVPVAVVSVGATVLAAGSVSTGAS